MKNKAKYKKSLLFLFLLAIPVCFLYGGIGASTPGESNYSGIHFKDNFLVSSRVLGIDSAQGIPSTRDEHSGQKLVFKISDVSNIDSYVENYIRDIYPLISDDAVKKISSAKTINKFLTNDTLGIVDVYAVIYVPKYYLDPDPQILWELNIPEFGSRIYQIYESDTILIDTWPNVVGKQSTRTYTGHYEAFRLRNWPFWKDPESADSIRPTPPGPSNPLGLFVVHYDENSLRYLHGTNKNYLLKNEYRALSHGCVRNDNGNIAKMKEFIIKKVVKSEDLSYWLNSKKSMIFELKEEDRFPVRIIYKTFDINRDEYGDYIIFFKDVYNYTSNFRLSRYDDPSLITVTTLENIMSEFRQEHPSIQITDERLIPILEKLISDYKDYQKYYFDDIIAEHNIN